jgi:hypothetical protein
VLINRLAFPPVTGSNYADHIVPIRKAHRENAISDLAKTIVTLFSFAVAYVLPYAFAGFPDLCWNPIRKALLPYE